MMKQKIWAIQIGLSVVFGLISALLILLVSGSVEGAFLGSVWGIVSLTTLGALALSMPILTRLEEDEREDGEVKWFNVTKGFGFVTRENGEDVFVHFRSIRGRGHRSLQEGQRVRFGVVESAKGLQAEDVTILRQK